METVPHPALHRAFGRWVFLFRPWGRGVRLGHDRNISFHLDSPAPLPQWGQRPSWKRAPFPRANQVQHRGRQVAQRRRLLHNMTGRRPRGVQDQQRDVHALDEQIVTVADEVVLAKQLPVVRGDDDERVFEVSAAAKSLKKPLHLQVEVEDTAIVGVPKGEEFVRGILEAITERRVARLPGPKEASGFRTGDVGAVGVEVIEECEEWSARVALACPGEDGSIQVGSRLSPRNLIAAGEMPDRLVVRDLAKHLRRLENLTRRTAKAFVMHKPTLQPECGTEEMKVGHEPGRLVTVAAKGFRQRGVSNSVWTLVADLGIGHGPS